MRRALVFLALTSVAPPAAAYGSEVGQTHASSELPDRPTGMAEVGLGWLVLPEDASAENPAPLTLWVHGGPLNSWNSWSWRWCPSPGPCRRQSSW